MFKDNAVRPETSTTLTLRSLRHRRWQRLFFPVALPVWKIQRNAGGLFTVKLAGTVAFSASVNGNHPGSPVCADIDRLDRVGNQ